MSRYRAALSADILRLHRTTQSPQPLLSRVREKGAGEFAGEEERLQGGRFNHVAEENCSTIIAGSRDVVWHTSGRSIG